MGEDEQIAQLEKQAALLQGDLNNANAKADHYHAKFDKEVDAYNKALGRCITAQDEVMELQQALAIEKGKTQQAAARVATAQDHTASWIARTSKAKLEAIDLREEVQRLKACLWDFAEAASIREEVPTDG